MIETCARCREDYTVTIDQVRQGHIHDQIGECLCIACCFAYANEYEKFKQNFLLFGRGEGLNREPYDKRDY